MSAEAATVGIAWKPLVYLFGGLLAAVKGLLIYIWARTTKDIRDNREEVSDLKEKIETGYYTREHIDLIVQPLKASVDKNNEINTEHLRAVKEMTMVVRQLAEKVDRIDDRRH